MKKSLPSHPRAGAALLVKVRAQSLALLSLVCLARCNCQSPPCEAACEKVELCRGETQEAATSLCQPGGDLCDFVLPSCSDCLEGATCAQLCTPGWQCLDGGAVVLEGAGSCEDAGQCMASACQDITPCHWGFSPDCSAVCCGYDFATFHAHCP